MKKLPKDQRSRAKNSNRALAHIFFEHSDRIEKTSHTGLCLIDKRLSPQNKPLLLLLLSAIFSNFTRTNKSLVLFVWQSTKRFRDSNNFFHWNIFPYREWNELSLFYYAKRYFLNFIRISVSFSCCYILYWFIFCTIEVN